MRIMSGDSGTMIMLIDKADIGKAEIQATTPSIKRDHSSRDLYTSIVTK